jgi:hypothetical protein
MTRNVICLTIFLAGGCRHWFDEECEDTGTTTTTVTTGDTGSTGTTQTGDTGSTGTTDTGTVCVPVAEVCDGLDQNCDGVPDDGLDFTYYTDADGDGYGDAAAPVVLACDQLAGPGLVLDSTDCDDTNILVYPGAHEDDSNLIDDNCDGVVDECGAGYSRLWGQYVGPVGSTNVVVSGEVYDPAGNVIRAMSPFVDGVDGWTVDSSVVGQVTFSNDTCMSDLDWPYFSASFTGVGTYSCVGDANPTYTAFGTWAFEEDGVTMATVYVNNWETPTGFPFGYGGGCEVKVQ